MAATRRLAELRAPELARRLGPGSVVVQPIGATEQHGPHLPFITDLLIAEEVAAEVVTRYGDEHDLWLLPPLAYSKSNEHAWSAGTIWLSATTLLAVLDDIGRCIAATAARRLVFLNGHGGNSSLLSVANRELRLRYGLLTFLTHPSVPPDQGGPAHTEELGMGIHGGLGETSMVLHLRPDLVDMDAAVRNIPESLASNRHVRFGGSVPFGWMSNDFGPDGHVGDPTLASAERGKEMFEAAVANLGQQMGEIAAFDLPVTPPG